MKKFTLGALVVLLVVAVPLVADTVKSPATPDNVITVANVVTTVPDNFNFQDVGAIVNTNAYTVVDSAECPANDLTITKAESSTNATVAAQITIPDNFASVQKTVVMADKTQVNNVVQYTVDTSPFTSKMKVESKGTVNSAQIQQFVPQPVVADTASSQPSANVGINMTATDNQTSLVNAAPVDTGITLNVQKETIAASAGPVAILHDEVVLTAPTASSLKVK